MPRMREEKQHRQFIISTQDSYISVSRYVDLTCELGKSVRSEYNGEQKREEHQASLENIQGNAGTRWN